MTKRRVTLILSFALLLALVAIPAAAQSYPDPGTGSTYTELVNTTTDSTSVSITYYDQGGSSTVGPNRTIPGNGSTAIDPASSQLPQGYNGAGVVSSNKPLASTVNTQWTGGSGDGFQMGMYTGPSAGSSRICFPSLFKVDGAIIASFTVQNTGTASASINIDYYSRTGTHEGQYTDSIPQGAQHTYDLRTSSATVPNLTDGWDGGAVVEVTNGQSVAGVGVVNQSGRSSTYNAADCESLSGETALAVTTQYRGYNGSDPDDVSSYYLFSAINVQNLEGTPADVTWDYIPRDPLKPTLQLQATIPAYSVKGWNTRNDPEFDALGGARDLGEEWDGTVNITSDKAIAATVITQWNRGGNFESGYYAAANASSSSTSFWVPGVRRDKVGDVFPEFSAVLVQNIGNASTDISTKYYDRSGSLILTYDDTLTPGQGVGYNTRSGTGDTGNLGDTFEGHAVITSDGQPLSVVLNSIRSNPGGSGTTNGVSQ